MVRNINIVAVGSLKEGYLREAVAEYTKRISRFVNVKIIEVTEERQYKNMPACEVIEKEGKRLLEASSGEVIALDASGKMPSSEDFADILAEYALTGKSEISYLIGGSYGLSNEVKSKASCIISFGRLTYPHQLIRVMLAEQIYRACTIKANICYHK